MPRPHTETRYPVRGPVHFTCVLGMRDMLGVFFHTVNQKNRLTKDSNSSHEGAKMRYSKKYKN